MKLIKSFLIFLYLLLLSSVPVHAYEIPDGYLEYGDCAEEVYYDDLGLLAVIVYAEAGNQDLKGKGLVADVILNRMDDPRFPNTISEVIFQDNQFSTATTSIITSAGYNVTQDCYDAVMNELSSRIDSEVLFFSAGNSLPYGQFAYQYGDHYFNYWN